MTTVHYLHRLPADYDLLRIRRRATGRGAVWDTAPDPYFKAFLLQDAAESPGVVAAVTAQGPVRWRFSRYRLAEDVAQKPDEGVLSHDVLYLAQALRHTLSSGSTP